MNANTESLEPKQYRATVLPEGYVPPEKGIPIYRNNFEPYDPEFCAAYRNLVKWRTSIIQKMSSAHIDQVLSYKKA